MKLLNPTHRKSAVETKPFTSPFLPRHFVDRWRASSVLLRKATTRSHVTGLKRRLQVNSVMWCHARINGQYSVQFGTHNLLPQWRQIDTTMKLNTNWKNQRTIHLIERRRTGEKNTWLCLFLSVDTWRETRFPKLPSLRCYCWLKDTGFGLLYI